MIIQSLFFQKRPSANPTSNEETVRMAPCARRLMALLRSVAHLSAGVGAGLSVIGNWPESARATASRLAPQARQKLVSSGLFAAHVGQNIRPPPPKKRLPCLVIRLPASGMFNWLLQEYSQLGSQAVEW